MYPKTLFELLRPLLCCGVVGVAHLGLSVVELMLSVSASSKRV